MIADSHPNHLLTTITIGRTTIKTIIPSSSPLVLPTIHGHIFRLFSEGVQKNWGGVCTPWEIHLCNHYTIIITNTEPSHGSITTMIPNKLPG
jgi:hypothetical protein